MLTNLKIICRLHAHPVHQNSVDILGPGYVVDDFFTVEASLVQSNSRSLRDLLVLESNCTEKDYFCCEEMAENNGKKISRTSQQKYFYYTRVPGFSGIGCTRQNPRFSITFALYVKKIFISRVCKCVTRNVFTMCRKKYISISM